MADQDRGPGPAGTATEQRRLPEHVTTPLLTLITTRSMDEDYAHVAQKRAAAGETPTPASRPHWASLVLIGVLGVMAAIVTVQTDRQAETNELSRAALVEQITSRRDQLRNLQGEVARLSAANQAVAANSTRLQDQLEETETRTRRVELVTGYSRVRGPGVRITVNNPEGADVNDEIRDEDLAYLVDGLWEAGAEAIAVNDQRLHLLGGIRNTGRAVHVNGRPVNPPYVVQAIGDPRTLQAGLIQTSQGQEWFSLVNFFGFLYRSENVDDIRLPAAPERPLRDVIELNADPDGAVDGEGSAP
jgi:uncharacterized protein YlxW (UPF0749 family)